MENQPTKKNPIWKTILIWIVGIWAVLTLAGVVIELFMFFTIGTEINLGTLSIGLLALAIVLKLGIIKYQKSNKQKPKRVDEAKTASNFTIEHKEAFVEQLKKEPINREKFILPAVILLACIILGGFYYASQVSKQKSIEKQQADQKNQVSSIIELYNAYNEKTNLLKMTDCELFKKSITDKTKTISLDMQKKIEKICVLKNQQKEILEKQIDILSINISKQGGTVPDNKEIQSNNETTQAITNSGLVSCLTFFNKKVMVSKEDCNFIEQLNDKSELSKQDYDNCIEKAIKEQADCNTAALKYPYTAEENIDDCYKEAKKEGKNCNEKYNNILKEIWKNY